VSNSDVSTAMTKAFEPYCKGYCKDAARLEVNVVDEFVNAHLFLSAADHAAISPGEIGNHLSDCFDQLGKHLGEGRERLGMDFVIKP
jgi:hypothetical protein